MLDRDGAGVPQFYRRVLDQLQGIGATTTILRRDHDALAAPQGQDFDLVHNGGVRRVQALNLAPAYLPGFYYMDPAGIYFESSIATRPFRPEIIEAQYATPFVADLRRKWVLARKSRHAQPVEVQAFGQGHIAMFLQDWSDPVERARHMTAELMVKTVVKGAAGRQVVVKPHPNNSARETQKIRQWLVRHHPQVRLTDANIHDILPGAAVTVSISSSVALEGMLHHVPAVLFGRSDLHHCAETVVQPDDWPAALDQALTRDWPYDAFLLWFLRRQNVDAGRPFLQKLVDRMTGQGADLAALGIVAP
ncbi:MAG: hypothetical protein H7317_12275 [Pseudorhodobacter sp.]|nr:hypothetical protein [Pseudorhodobacter sp.]